MERGRYGGAITSALVGSARTAQCQRKAPGGESERHCARLAKRKKRNRNLEYHTRGESFSLRDSEILEGLSIRALPTSELRSPSSRNSGGYQIAEKIIVRQLQIGSVEFRDLHDAQPACRSTSHHVNKCANNVLSMTYCTST